MTKKKYIWVVNHFCSGDGDTDLYDHKPTNKELDELMCECGYDSDIPHKELFFVYKETVRQKSA